MDNSHLKQIRAEIGKEIINSRGEIGSIQLGKLVRLADDCTDLLKYLENPVEYNRNLNKVNKSMNLGVKP